MNPNSTAFGGKLTAFQEHAMATYQKYLDDEARTEAAIERVIENDDELRAAVLYAKRNNLLDIPMIDVIERYVKEPI